MNKPAVVLCLLGLAMMGALPLVFFRRGRFNLPWLLTAAPFFTAALCLLAGLAGWLSRVPLSNGLLQLLTYAAVAATAGGIALLGCTLGAHRESLSLWHQEDDTPQVLVTRGPYAHVRHPFYASFLLLLIGTACALPHPLTITVLLAGWVQMERTARREERRLLASPFGAAYASFMRHTGRFVPASLLKHPNFLR